MKKLPYHLVDVFTRRPFGGNPLAVFPDGRGISATLMQALAKEFNLSETTFVLPPEDTAHTYRVRIFTPAAELPMAGHPTIGTSFVLAQKRLIELAGRETTILLEERVGTIPVTFKTQDRGAIFIQMSQPLPAFGPQLADQQMAADILNHINSHGRNYVGDLKFNRTINVDGQDWKAIGWVKSALGPLCRRETTVDGKIQWYFTKSICIRGVTHTVRIVVLWKQQRDAEPVKILVTNRTYWYQIDRTLSNLYGFTGPYVSEVKALEQAGLIEIRAQDGPGNVR
jgi:hypothetical protein